MKERPILFSGPMIRAILQGRKTQTRRVIKPQPKVVHGWNGIYLQTNQIFRNGAPGLLCPCGMPGDDLWVRETWRSVKSVTYGHSKAHTLAYRADDQTGVLPGKWKPSIHMPRWASRITLEVISVSIQKVQNISEEDALAEGCSAGADGYIPEGKNGEDGKEIYPGISSREHFEDVWNRINSGRGFGWDVNPWVWVIEFKMQELLPPPDNCAEPGGEDCPG